MERLTSLDAFRGAVIAFMILVNTPGTGEHVYPPLRHAHWHGWTPTDVVFPSFVWITGVTIALSLGRKLEKGEDKWAIYKQVLKRSAILFVLGVVLYSFPVPDPGTFRILGVLQRIAICYAVAAAIFLTNGIRGQIAWTAAFLLGYWALMHFGGDGRLDIEGNFAHKIDRWVLGTHNYRNAKTWDPEGIVSTLPAISSCLLGLLAGHIIKARKMLWLVPLGLMLIGLGQLGDPWLPINKSIWTSTFALFMAGLDFVLFALFYWLADVQKYHRLMLPFVIFGMNAIAVYLFSEFGDIILSKIPMGGGQSLRVWIYEHWFAPFAAVPENASLAYAIAFVLVNFLFALWLYRRRLFIRV